MKIIQTHLIWVMDDFGNTIHAALELHCEDGEFPKSQRKIIHKDLPVETDTKLYQTFVLEIEKHAQLLKEERGL